jgi:DNA-directed RNA polymerase subunit M/transcription elongation factor TFIIS
MAEIIFIILIILVSRAFFLMLCCPNCKTLKSIFLRKKMKRIDDEGREQINCKACNYTWKRLSIPGGG